MGRPPHDYDPPHSRIAGISSPVGLPTRRDSYRRRDHLPIGPDLVGRLGVLFRIHGQVHGAATMSGEGSSLRLSVVIYYPAAEIPNEDLARRLKGLEWWIDTRENIPGRKD